MGIDYHNVEEQGDVTKIRPAIDTAYADSKPVVLLIGQRPS
jgi:thiamine pyrophosphate-dependent acetolactate synthase large subunit-like protein